MSRKRDPLAKEQPAAGPLPRVDQLLCFALYRASNRMGRAYRPLLDALGLTYPQYLVLLVLWDQQTATVGALGEALDLDSGTLTPLLKRMETNGLIRRRRDPDDERRVVVDLTEKGAALRHQAEAVPPAMAGRIAISLEEADTLCERVKQLADAIKA